MKDMKGVVVGIVREIDAVNACVKVEFPWMQPPQISHWARIATFMSGGKRGGYFMPELDDEALVAFDQGQFEHPFIIGYLWNGPDRPPADEGKLRTIRSLNGHEVTMYDPPPSGGDRGFVRIRDAHGNTIELANGRLTITSPGTLRVQAPNVIINGRVVAPVGPPI